MTEHVADCCKQPQCWCDLFWRVKACLDLHSELCHSLHNNSL
jgi:hypothetical protein